MSEGLRPIDIGKRVRRVQVESTPPDLVHVPIKDLLINDTYQRPILKQGWRQIERIAANFDWALFVPAIVAPVGQKYALIDGQHRAHAAYLAGFDAIPALCVEMTATEQARAFAAINTQVTRLTSQGVFKAALAAREPWALDADMAVSDAGCRLMPYLKSSSDKKAGEVYAVTLVRKHVDAGEGEVVTACLSAIRRADTDHYPGFYVGPVLKGFFEAVASNVQYLRKVDLFEFCQAVDICGVHDEAGSRASAQRVPKGPIFRSMLIEELERFRQEREAA